MDRLHENRIYTGTVESYSSEGLASSAWTARGVRPPGRPGGDHRPENHQGDEDRRRREIVKIHKPSPDRAQPECPDYGRCGGCDFQHLTYPEELWAKRQRSRTP